MRHVGIVLVLMGLLFAVITANGMDRQSALNRVLAAPLLTLGHISYSLYLFHFLQAQPRLQGSASFRASHLPALGAKPIVKNQAPAERAAASLHGAGFWNAAGLRVTTYPWGPGNPCVGRPGKALGVSGLLLPFAGTMVRGSPTCACASIAARR